MLLLVCQFTKHIECESKSSLGSSMIYQFVTCLPHTYRHVMKNDKYVNINNHFSLINKLDTFKFNKMWLLFKSHKMYLNSKQKLKAHEMRIYHFNLVCKLKIIDTSLPMRFGMFNKFSANFICILNTLWKAYFEYT